MFFKIWQINCAEQIILCQQFQNCGSTDTKLLHFNEMLNVFGTFQNDQSRVVKHLYACLASKGNWQL